MTTSMDSISSTPQVMVTKGSLLNSQCDESLDLVFWVLDGMIAVVIFIGNILTCLVFLSKRHLRQNYMNIFLLSLALSDMLMALLVAPWFASYCETKCKYTLSNYCFWFGMMRDIPFQSVVLNLVAITYDRHLAVFRPLVYGAKMTKRRVCIILALVWCTPVITALTRMTWTFSDIPSERKTFIDRSFNIFLIFVFVLLPITGIFIVNLMIMYTIQKHNRVAPRHQASQSRSHSETSESERRERVRKKRGTMSCVLVVFVFFACWLPRIVYNFFFLAKTPHLATTPFIKVSMFFLLLQSTVNPIIYSFYRQEFRQAALGLLRR
ncbi:D(1)-like dopamine receptor [Actinia tenebrosa]|uniref:D(1)-like dopamine receptor n=1 Tax=Actinia tenebrosa TaxID=6105 RepID=A0A6P8IWA0_ACTTE|nr:D(1)-like dopamine receptor [Actinia tenebrosa]XP_031571642.1 D(1)-like dopamine receptor [Actinia tenebrosa]